MSAQNKPTASEMVQSLTGFEELAIEQYMKVDPYIDGVRKPVAVTRGLVFVIHRREGKSDRDARDLAMNMPAGNLDDYFADEEPELDEDNPETESGKDSTPSE